ncbi:hypothetical protein ACQP3F_30900, partial [Escherichia coli]
MKIQKRELKKRGGKREAVGRKGHGNSYSHTNNVIPTDSLQDTTLSILSVYSHLIFTKPRKARSQVPPL